MILWRAARKLMFLLILMTVSLAVVITAAVFLMAHALLKPPRMSDGKALYLLKRLTPDDLGMAYEKVTFKVRDEPGAGELNLVGWWIPHPAGGDRTVVLLHGYADAKVGAIAWAPTWRALGYHILAIDLRAHGESEGRYTTAGARERSDIDQVLNQLHVTRPVQATHLVLFGISLGTSTAIAVAAGREDLAAIVLESPIARFQSGVRAHAELLALPLPSLLPWVMKAAEWLSGADVRSVRPIDRIPNVKCPILAIQSGDDPFVPPEDASAIRSAIDSRTDGSRVWLVDDTPHLMALSKDPDTYRQQIARFFANSRE